METFVLNVPKELIAGRYWDGDGGYCALGCLTFQLVGHRGVEWPSYDSPLLGIGIRFGLGDQWDDWMDTTFVQNDRLTNPRSRVTNFKRRLRALESYGHVQFLFLDELRDTRKCEGLEALMADTFGATTTVQRCDVVDAL